MRSPSTREPASSSSPRSGSAPGPSRPTGGARVDDKQGLVHAALDAGITFFDTAPVYGDAGFGETILADILGRRDDVVITTKCGYDIDAPAHRARALGATAGLAAGVGARCRCEASLRRLGGERIDLLQLHNVRIEPVRDDDLWAELDALQREGKVGELGVALGPAIGWVDEGVESLQRPPDRVAPDGVQPAGAGAGAHLRGPARRVPRGAAGLIARVPHASDVLSGKITRDTEFEGDDHRAHRKRENLLDLFDKADTLAFLHEPGDRAHDRSGRGRRHPRHRRLRDRAARRA